MNKEQKKNLLQKLLQSKGAVEMKRFLIKIIKVILFLLCMAMLVLTTPISIIVDLGNKIEKLVINFQEFLFKKSSIFVNWLDKIEKEKTNE